MKLCPVYIQIILTSNRGNPPTKLPFRRVAIKSPLQNGKWVVNHYNIRLCRVFFAGEGGYLKVFRLKSHEIFLKQEVVSSQPAFCLYCQCVECVNMLVRFWIATRSSQNQSIVKRQAMKIPGQKFDMLKLH